MSTTEEEESSSQSSTTIAGQAETTGFKEIKVGKKTNILYIFYSLCVLSIFHNDACFLGLRRPTGGVGL